MELIRCNGIKMVLRYAERDWKQSLFIFEIL